MEIQIREGEEFIRLGQAMKKAQITGSGSESKEIIAAGAVKVNGKTEERRGRKLYPGDTVSFESEKFTVTK